MNLQTLTGGCLCGAVRFHVEPPTKWCCHCHCQMCRKAQGAPFVTWVGVEDSRFRFVGGESELNWYPSSEDGRRGFCRNCGSSLFFRSPRWSGEIHIALPYFDMPIDREPSGHVYYDRRVPWVTLGDHLPRYGGASGTEPLTEQPAGGD